jgi:hypothetical protein
VEVIGLTPATKLTLERFYGTDRKTEHTCTVTELIADNGEDVEFLHEMLGDLMDQGFTVQGGGAAPIVRVQVVE